MIAPTRSHERLKRFGRSFLRTPLCLPMLASDVAPRGVAPIEVEPGHDFAVTSPWLHHWPQENDGVLASLARSGADYVLRFPDVGDFLLRHGSSRVVFDVRADLAPETLEHVLVDQVLPRYHAHAGAVMLHASGVRVGDRGAIVFAGRSGSGKSTLAALLRRAGHAVLADDCLQLDAVDGEVAAIATYAGMRLNADSRASLAIARPAGNRDALASKQRIDVEPDPVGSARALALYLLGEGAATSPTIEEIRPADACRAIIKHTFRLDVTDPGSTAAHFARCAEIARRLPAFRLDYPRDFARADALVECVEAHVLARAG